MNLQQFKEKMMKNPEFKKEYEKFDLWFELQTLWIKLRVFILSKLKK